MAKRVRRSKEDSIEKVLDAAFLFYSTMPYDRVIFEELAKSIGITSGGIFYHFKSKQALFEKMCDKFLLEDSSFFTKLEIYENSTFLEYIDKYITTLEEQKKKAEELGVENLNFALINITNQALFYYPDFVSKATEWVQLQEEQWKKVIIKSIVRGDLKDDIDINLTAELFEDIYRSHSYASMTTKDGIDLTKLKASFIYLYNLLKK